MRTSDHDRGYEPRLHRRHGTPSPGSDAALDENGTGLRRVLLQSSRTGVRACGGQRVEVLLLTVEAAEDAGVAGADESG